MGPFEGGGLGNETMCYASRASGAIQVSVKTRMSNAPSCILSFIRAALLTAYLEVSRPSFKLAWRRLQAWLMRCNLKRMLELLRGLHIL